MHWKASAAAILLTPLTLVPQDKTAVQIRVESKLVLVDLIATDERGDFVSNLQPGEIRVFEDNEERALASFELRRPDPIPGTSGLNPLAAEGKTARALTTGIEQPAPGIAQLFLVDLQSIAPTDLPRVRDAIREFVLSHSRARDCWMLAGLRSNLRIFVPFTKDQSDLLGSLDRLTVSGDSDVRLLRFSEELENILVETEASMLEGAAEKKVFTDRVVRLAKEYIQRENLSVQSACESASDLVRSLASLPGRKDVMLFSGGYRSNIAVTIQNDILRRMEEKWPQDSSKLMEELRIQVRSLLGAMASQADINTYLRSTIEEANRARVSFYCIDARGLIAPEDIRFRGFSNSHAQVMSEEINQPQDYLRALASGTGGRWFLNDNDLQAGLRRAYQDAAEYYELSYVPAGSAAPGSLHKISVQLSRPGVRLSYRQSYLEPGTYDPESRAVENAFKFPALFEDFPIEVDTATASGELIAEVFIPTRVLLFQHDAARYRCDLAVYMALFDDQGNQYGGGMLFSKSYHLDVDGERLARIINSDNLTTKYRGKIAPGSYRLRVVVRQIPAGKTATLERRITV
jgi:VWFA-related protein